MHLGEPRSILQGKSATIVFHLWINVVYTFSKKGQFKDCFTIYMKEPPNACVSRGWAGVDFAWEQEKPEARKMLVNRADSHTSGARCVGRLLGFSLACLLAFFRYKESCAAHCLFDT